MNKLNKFSESSSLAGDLQQASSDSQPAEILDQAELNQVVGGAGGIFGTDIIDWTYFKRSMLP